MIQGTGTQKFNRINSQTEEQSPKMNGSSPNLWSQRRMGKTKERVGSASIKRKTFVIEMRQNGGRKIVVRTEH